MIFARVLLLLVALMLSLHLGCSATLPPWTPQNVSETCYKLIANSMEMECICRTKITPRTRVLTRSPVFKVKHPVSIFLSQDRTANFITINKSPLQMCNKLVVLDTYIFNCSRKDASHILLIEESNLYCFPHHLYVSDLVAETCKHPDIGFVKKTQYDIIHFSTHECCSTFHLPWRTLVTLELLAMLVQLLFTQ